MFPPHWLHSMLTWEVPQSLQTAVDTTLSGLQQDSKKKEKKIKE